MQQGYDLRETYLVPFRAHVPLYLNVGSISSIAVYYWKLFTKGGHGNKMS